MVGIRSHAIISSQKAHNVAHKIYLASKYTITSLVHANKNEISKSRSSMMYLTAKKLTITEFDSMIRLVGPSLRSVPFIHIYRTASLVTKLALQVIRTVSNDPC